MLFGKPPEKLRTITMKCAIFVARLRVVAIYRQKQAQMGQKMGLSFSDK